MARVQLRVFEGFGGLPKRRLPAAVTIGNFYAVHRGHLALVTKVLQLGRQKALASTVVTFEPHPGQVLHPEEPVLLVSAERKLELLEAAGVEQTWILPFTKQLSLLEPEEFIEQILVEELRMKALVVGVNFRFGHFARGDVTMLRTFGRKLGFSVQSVRLAEIGGRSISSTAIRHALGAGDLDWANKALGRPYCLPGMVTKGTGRGRKLGYPTANLRPYENLCVPGAGIYAGHFLCDGRRLLSAISIGSNPTFGPGPATVEAYILDFEGNLYGKRAEIEFHLRLRDHVEFSGAAELQTAISQDVEEVRRLTLRTASRRH